MTKRLILFSALCLSLCGCFTVDKAVAPNSNTHIHIENYGWYLFGVIPLVCGNATPENIFPFALFRDDVTMDKLQRHVDIISQKTHTTTSNMSYIGKEEIFFQVPFSNISVPIPYFITYRDLQLSGELK